MLHNDEPEEMFKVTMSVFGVKLNFTGIFLLSASYLIDLQIICTVKKHIMSGGPRRLPFTVPSLIFSALRVSFFNDVILSICIIYTIFNMLLFNWILCDDSLKIIWMELPGLVRFIFHNWSCQWLYKDPINHVH